MTKYVKHNYTQTVRNTSNFVNEFVKEFDIRLNKPNLLIPRFVYRIRRDHYVYWEISRLARGLPKTFTYSNWDNKAVL